MTRIEELVREGGFKEKDEVIKFFFVIHNTDHKVREYLIDKGDPTKSCSDFLNLVRSVESMVQMETILKQLLQNVGKLSINAVQNHTQASGQQQQRSSSRQSNKCGGVKGYYAKFCKTKNPRNPKENYSCRDTFEASPER